MNEDQQAPICVKCGGPREDGMAWLKDMLCESCEAEYEDDEEVST